MCARSPSAVSWTGTAGSAMGPATAYAPPLQASASLQTISGTQTASAVQTQLAADPLPAARKPDKVYNNNSMPLGAAIGIPLGSVATVCLLLLLAHYQRKRTQR